MAMAAAALPQQTLPHDLIVEILSWLPVKSLIRFSCVSKTWNSLISHPAFVKLHLHRSPQNSQILLTFVDSDMDTCVTPCSISRLLENPSSTVDNGCRMFNHYSFVLGVCNGLVCLLDSSRLDELEEHRVLFWNPATRIMFEDSPRLRTPSSDYKIGQYSWQCGYPKCGFGYDDSSDTYKVVAILMNIKSQQREVRVHCMGDTCWRKVLTCPAFPILRKHYGQFVNGTVNWLALRRPGSSYQWKTVTIDELVIFSYDLKKETYGYLSMPDGLLEVPRSEPYLGVLRGCLFLSHDYRGSHSVVWIMREFGVERSWAPMLNTLEAPNLFSIIREIIE